MDRKLDVAAPWINAPHGIDPVPVAKHSPQLGESVEIWGYGPKRFRSFMATVSRPDCAFRATFPRPWSEPKA